MFMPFERRRYSVIPAAESTRSTVVGNWLREPAVSRGCADATGAAITIDAARSAPAKAWAEGRILTMSRAMVRRGMGVGAFPDGGFRESVEWGVRSIG
jgi:hypothetical protein